MKQTSWPVSCNILFSSIVLYMILLLPFIGSTEPLDNWHLRNPLPTPHFLGAAASGNGVAVAVGQNGTIVASTDSVNWTLQPSGTTENLWGVAFGVGRFVAVGSGQTILTSTDGVAWTSGNPGLSGSVEFYGIFHGNGLFLAFDGSGAIATSPDGDTWTRQTAATTYGLSGMTFGDGLFAAVGYGGAVLTSPDGAVWTQRVSGTSSRNLTSIAYGNQTFAAVGSSGALLTSTNGETWTPRTTGTTTGFYGITYGNGIFVAVGYGGAVLTSADGVIWTSQSSGVKEQLNDVIFRGDHFITVGASGVILTSNDGVTWTTRTSGTREFFHQIAYGNNTFVAVGESGTVATSSGGTSWNSHVVGTGDNFRLVAYGNGIFVAIQFGIPYQIMTSSDGIRWSALPLALGDVPNAIAYGNGLFVAVGYGGVIRSSTDGLSWTPRTSGTTVEFTDIAYGNNLFIAVGAGRTVLTSPDGMTWTRAEASKEELSRIAYGNHRFVAFGGSIFVSLDGTTWEKRASTPNHDLTDIAFVEDAFVITGDAVGYSGGTSGAILSSAHGLIWTTEIVEQTSMLSGIARGNDTLVAVGASGAILQSDSPANAGTAESILIETLYLETESHLAAKNLIGLMALYHDGYVNGGSTKAMEQARYEKIFADYTAIQAMFNLSGLTVEGDRATITATLAWTGTHASTGEIHSWTEAAKATLKKLGTAWQFYGDQATYGLTVQSNHDGWSGEYRASIRIFDPNREITALEVAGPGIAGSLDMTSFLYDSATASWFSTSSIPIGDSSHFPNLSSLTYTVAITDARGTSPRTAAVAGLLPTPKVYYVGPANVAVRGPLTFRWAAKEADRPVSYRVLLYRGACPSPGAPPPGSPLWIGPLVAAAPYRTESSVNVGTTAVKYGGPSLPNGDYAFVVQAVDAYGNTASAKVAGFRMAIGPGEPLDLWHERNPHINFANSSLRGACGNDICLYLSMDGRVMASNLNTGSWQEAEVVVEGDLHGAAYGNGTFVVVGDGGAIATSKDAVSWTVVASGTTNSLAQVAYGNGVFAAVGDAGTILTSVDGDSWTARTSRTVQNISGVIYQDLSFIAANASGLILASADGISWNPNPGWAMNDLNAVAYGHGIFVAVDETGKVRTSADGKKWAVSEAGPGSRILGLAYGNGTFVAVGGTAIFSSTDGVAWTSRESGTTSSLRGVRFAKDRFWAVGDFGAILTSFDGVTWTTMTSGTWAFLRDIAYGNSRYVAVGGDAILTSDGGQVWSSTTSPVTNLVRIAYGNGRFVALNLSGTILTSTDGVTWTTQSIGAYKEDISVTRATTSVSEAGSITGIITTPQSPPSSWLVNGFTDLLFVGNTFVATTSDSILTSTDGAIWTYRQRFPWGDTRYPGAFFSDGLSSIAYGGGTFVAVGSGGFILQSGSISELFQKGDLNGDRRVDLLDAILALQVITGQNGSGIRPDYVSSGADVDGDEKIGLAEMVYILQSIARAPETAGSPAE